VAEAPRATQADEEPIETELKLSAAGSAPLRRLAGLDRLGPMQLGPPRAFLELDRYLDTPDGRLAEVGWACRLRQRGRRYVVSLKGPPVRSTSNLQGGWHRRPEIEGPATAALDATAWAESPARERLLELAGGQELQEWFSLRQHRTQRGVRDGSGPTATLSLDRVEVFQHGKSIGHLWCVELELLPTTAGLRETAGQELLAGLLAVGDLAAEPLTKLERALALIHHASP
jgi:inorganic triphosphatase YgiF